MFVIGLSLQSVASPDNWLAQLPCYGLRLLRLASRDIRLGAASTGARVRAGWHTARPRFATPTGLP